MVENLVSCFKQTERPPQTEKLVIASSLVSSPDLLHYVKEGLASRVNIPDT